MSEDNSYAVFLGCTIPTKEFAYEASMRAVCKELGIGLKDMEGFICCGYPSETPIAHDTWLSMSAYNIVLAEEMGLDMVVPCNGCFGALKRANEILKADKKERDHINDYLKGLGKEYKGSIEVKHLIEVLNENRDVITEKVTKPLSEVRAANHLGCHVLRPSEILNFDDPENPKILDEMVELTGAESLDYITKAKCCGNVLRGLNDEISLTLAKEKMDDLRNHAPDCMITICPACHIQYDIGQMEMKSKFKEDYGIPVLFYPQLLGLAMGLDPESLGMNLLKIKPKALLEKIGV